MLTSQRTFTKLAAFGAVCAVGFGIGSAALAAPAEPLTSPHALADGREVTFADPWTGRDSDSEAVLVDALELTSGEATLTVGYVEAPSSAGDFADAVLEAALPDPSLAPPVAGGSTVTSGADGAVESEIDYQLNVYDGGSGLQLGILVHMTNQIDATVLVAPVAEFGTAVLSAQTSVTVGGSPVLPGIESTEIQADLDAGLEGLQSGAPGAVVGTDADGRGHFVDATGQLTVTWPSDWTVVSHNEDGTEITNPAGTFTIYPQIYTLDGLTWEEMAATDVDFLAGDQGPNATVVGPLVTDNGFSFTTDGDYGPRLAEGVAIATDPERYVMFFAASIAPGSDTQAIIAEIQAAVLINGAAPFQGMAALFEASGS